MELTASEIYKKLIEANIINATGCITMKLLNVRFNLNAKSAIGNILEEWFFHWMNENNIYCRPNLNSQEPPDFYLSEDNKKNLLEVKAFDATTAANFDISNFDTYIRALTINSYKLDSDYMIFGYELINGELKVRNVWLKKVWEICTSSEQYPIRAQVKQGKIVNIRPANWESSNVKYRTFETKKDFIIALEKTIKMYPSLSKEIDKKTWLQTVTNNYKEQTGIDLFD